MVDTRYCVAGRNRSGAWFIACRVPPKESLRILDELMFTDLTSGPAEQPYDVAARHIQKCGGLFWQTNAVGEYTTIAGIPSVVRDSNS